MSAQKTSPVVKMAGLGIVAIGIFYAGQGLQRVETMIADLPVQGQTAPKAEGAAAPNAPTTETMRNLHPLLIESSKKVAALRHANATPVTQTAEQLDALFERKDPEPEKKKVAEKAPPAAPAEPPAPPPVDYFKFLPQALKVQAVTGEGAVINGKFYAPGDKLPDFAYPKAGTTVLITPIVKAIDGESAVIEEPGSGRQFKVRLQ